MSMWAHNTSLTPPLLIGVPVSSQKSERSCICVLEVMYMCVRGHVYVCLRCRLCLFLRFLLQSDYGTYPTV